MAVDLPSGAQSRGRRRRRQARQGALCAATIEPVRESDKPGGAAIAGLGNARERIGRKLLPLRD